MDTYTIKTLIIGTCAISAIIAILYVVLSIQEAKLEKEVFLRWPKKELPKTKVNYWTRPEDHLVLSKALPDADLSHKINRSIGAIRYRRHFLRNK